MPTAPLPRIFASSCLALWLAATARAAEADPGQIARAALADLETRAGYGWEFRDLDGEIEDKTVWQDPSPAMLVVTDAGSRARMPRKKVIRILSPTVQGEYRADHWAVAEAGFAEGPKALAVVHPSGTRVVQSGKGEWQTIGQFRAGHGPTPGRLRDPNKQKAYSSGWAAFTSPLPHVLLPKLLRGAGNYRFERDEIVADIDAASARLLLGQDGGSRKLSSERFKGNIRMRVREGILRECRVVLDYDVDVTDSEEPSNEDIDVLILFMPPSPEPPAVPEAARALLANG